MSLFGCPESCTCRYCRIEILLDHLRDVMDVASANGLRGASSGDGSDIQRLTREAQSPAYRELVRVLDGMKRNAAEVGLRKHLLGYYEAPKRQAWARWRAPGLRGRLEWREGYRMERVVPSWVEMQRVGAGLVLVEVRFRKDPSLPGAFIEEIDEFVPGT